MSASTPMFRTIWDTSGTDTIQATGAVAATIDLRAATLQSEIGGGTIYVDMLGNIGINAVRGDG